MTMEEKNKLVIEYINKVRNELEDMGIPVSDEAVKMVQNRYIDSDKSFEEIKLEIDALVEEKLEEVRKRIEYLIKMKNKEPGITDLNVDYLGITLNEQDIDLMMIATAKNPDELRKALDKITNIIIKIPNVPMDEDQFISLRQEVFDSYMNSLTPKNEFLTNPKIQLKKKMEYLKKSGIVTSEEIQIIESIIQSEDINQVLSDLHRFFSTDKIHQMLQIIKDYSPIEKTGTIGTDLESYKRMYQELNKYNSITIDEEAKYGKVVVKDGTYDFSHLKKTLDYARANGKQVRLNTLLFYKDCPNYLYNLPVTEENKQRVKQALLDYVNQITLFIKNNGYEDTVRSIDVFNELLNRVAINEDTPYKYRGDIEQDPNSEDFENVKSGWQKFLAVEDLCDVISVARKNLPNTDFMYNDDNLTDPRKISATTDILNRIRKYEKEHGVKLIDSIGTQMHVDNDVTKEQIINMFDALKQYGLPIEITEFDMAMLYDVDGLSEEEIHDLRMKKMKEIYEAILECRERDNIRGLTIWSKTDAQNFRVSLENEYRIKHGMKPIETLHGGFYNNDMTEKKAKAKRKILEFNYHTHTYRSGHSEYVSDEQVLEAAKKAGIRMLGFSEHIPNTEAEFPDEDHRMLSSEVDGYLASITRLKEKNPDMTILVGFEAEFDPEKEAFLGEMREKVDYMILGQHFVKGVVKDGNPDYPIEYAKMVCKGIESGLFDIVAHPDCFMELRDTIKEEDRALFDRNCREASHMICATAAKMGIPLELNMCDALNNIFLKDGNLGIPHPLFWEIAKEYDVKVIKGIDAHSLKCFEDLAKGEELISGIEKMISDKMITGPYNPVVARKNNPKLQEAYKAHQKEALTFETHVIKKIVNGSLGKMRDKSDSDIMAATVGASLNSASARCDEAAKEKKKNLRADIKDISESRILSPREKTEKTKRKEQAIVETDKALAKQHKVIEGTKSNAINVATTGCETKQEFSHMMTQMTQHQTAKNPVQKNKAAKEIASFQQSKTGPKPNSQSNNNPKK